MNGGLAAPTPRAVAAPMQRLVRAAGWLLGSQLSSQVLRLAGNLILARLLAPDAFGLMAALNTVYFALVMLSDLGLWQIVVQNRRDDPRFLGTLWTVQGLRALLLCAVLLGLAWGLPAWVAWGGAQPGSALADPRLPSLLMAFALCALLQGGESMKLALAQRELRAAALARLELLAQLTALAVTVALAARYQSAWALAVGVCVSAAMRTLASHLWLPGPRLRPCWDGEAARELLRLGKWMVASSFLGFLAAHVEKLVLAAWLSASVFGLFSIASLLVAAVSGLLSSLNGQVVLAGLSEARRRDDQSLASTYAQLQRGADWVLGTACGLMLTLGPWVVHLGYDARYGGAAEVLQWLALGLIALRHQVIEQLMFVQGEPARVSANNLLRALSLGLVVPLALQWGGAAAAWPAVVACQFVAWPLSAIYLFRQGLWRLRQQLAWVPALALSSALGAGLSAGLSLLTK